MSFQTIVAAAQAQVDSFVGESFTYSSTTFTGIFNDGSEGWTFDDFCQRNEVDLVCVTSKAQWVTAAKVPANRGVVTYGGNSYVIESIRGNRSDDPTYTLALKRRT